MSDPKATAESWAGITGIPVEDARAAMDPGQKYRELETELQKCREDYASLAVDFAKLGRRIEEFLTKHPALLVEWLAAAMEPDAKT